MSEPSYKVVLPSLPQRDDSAFEAVEAVESEIPEISCASVDGSSPMEVSHRSTQVPDENNISEGDTHEEFTEESDLDTSSANSDPPNHPPTTYQMEPPPEQVFNSYELCITAIHSHTKEHRYEFSVCDTERFRNVIIKRTLGCTRRGKTQNNRKLNSRKQGSTVSEV